MVTTCDLSLNQMRKQHRQTLREAKFVPLDKMDSYDWENSTLITIGKKWVYYNALNKHTAKRENIKLIYDKSYDWEFEH